MQMRSRAYAQVMLRLRAVRGLIASNHDPAAQQASLPLIYTAVVLALLLAILEVDAHGAQLLSLGLLGDGVSLNPIFFAP